MLKPLHKVLISTRAQLLHSAGGIWSSAKGLVILRVWPSLTRFLTNSLYTPVAYWRINWRQIRFYRIYVIGSRASCRIATSLHQKLKERLQWHELAPQSAILGPLLYLAYINDLPKMFAFVVSPFEDDFQRGYSNALFHRVAVCVFH